MSTSTGRTEDRPLADFSMLDPRVQADPFPFYRKLHTECPVYRMPETDMYIISAYDDLREVLRDTETFSSDVRSQRGLQGDTARILEDTLKERGWAHVQTLQRTDPPQHARYREPLKRVFTGKRVKDLTPRIDALTHELIDRFAERGTCEFISEFALPFPGTIIAEQIGLDPSEIDRFKRWADAMIAPATKVLDESQMRAVAETELEAQHYLADVFEARRREPRDDIISGLVHAEVPGEEPLSVHELQNLMHQLITGGYETTTSALAHGLWLIVRYPEVAQRVRDNPDLLNRFIEETLRFEGPVQGLARQTTRDVEMHGTLIPKGAMVIVRYGAGNRDESQFPDADVFDIDRENAVTHMAFGVGVHSCIGALLARQELRSAYRALLDRLHDIELAQPLPNPVTESSLFFIPIKAMHLRFSNVLSPNGQRA